MKFLFLFFSFLLRYLITSKSKLKLKTSIQNRKNTLMNQFFKGVNQLSQSELVSNTIFEEIKVMNSSNNKEQASGLSTIITKEEIKTIAQNSSNKSSNPSSNPSNPSFNPSNTSNTSKSTYHPNQIVKKGDLYLRRKWYSTCPKDIKADSCSPTTKYTFYMNGILLYFVSLTGNSKSTSILGGLQLKSLFSVEQDQLTTGFCCARVTKIQENSCIFRPLFQTKHCI